MRVKKSEILKKMLIAGYLNQKELAKASQIAPSTISNMMRGVPLSFLTIGKIAKALNCDPIEIIKEEK